MITKGVLQRSVDIVALVMLFHSEDVTGVEPAVAGMSLCKPFQKLLRYFSQCQEGFSYRLKAVAYLLSGEVCRIFHLPAKSRRLSFMPGYEVDLGIVEYDLFFRSLHTQDVGNVAGGYGVLVRFKVDEPF